MAHVICYIESYEVVGLDWVVWWIGLVYKEGGKLSKRAGYLHHHDEKTWVEEKRVSSTK